MRTCFAPSAVLRMEFYLYLKVIDFESPLVPEYAPTSYLSCLYTSSQFLPVSSPSPHHFPFFQKQIATTLWSPPLLFLYQNEHIYLNMSAFEIRVLRNLVVGEVMFSGLWQFENVIVSFYVLAPQTFTQVSDRETRCCAVEATRTAGNYAHVFQITCLSGT